MRFFVEVHDNQPVAQGRVGKQIDTGHFFVRYDAPKQYGRIVSLAIMENFALFETEEELTKFVAGTSVASAAPAVDVPAGTPPADAGKPVDPAPPSGL